MRGRALAGLWMVTGVMWALEYLATGVRQELVFGFLAVAVTIVAVGLTVLPSIGRAYMDGWENGNAAGIALMQETAIRHDQEDGRRNVVALLPEVQMRRDAS